MTLKCATFTETCEIKTNIWWHFETQQQSLEAFFEQIKPSKSFQQISYKYQAQKLSISIHFYLQFSIYPNKYLIIIGLENILWSATAQFVFTHKSTPNGIQTSEFHLCYNSFVCVNFIWIINVDWQRRFSSFIAVKIFTTKQWEMTNRYSIKIS